jgi:hypothetical protein
MSKVTITQVDALLQVASKMPDRPSALFYAATLYTRMLTEAEAIKVFKEARQEALKLLPQLQ